MRDVTCWARVGLPEISGDLIRKQHLLMSHDLFRKEVMEANRGSWLGGISLAQPIRLWILTAVSVLTAAVVISFVVFGTYTRRSSVTGQLVPIQGLATVLAPVTGVVSQLTIPEGERVEAGQALAVLTVPRATQRSGNTQQALEQHLQQRQDGLFSVREAQQQQLHAQTNGLREQLVTARRELTQTESEVATRQGQIRIASETLGRLRQLEGGQYVSVLQIKQQESTVLEYTSQRQALERQAISTRRVIAQLEQALQELPGQKQVTEAGYLSELAQLEQERVQTEVSGALVVTAPMGGVMATRIVKAGQAVQAGQPLLSLLPGEGELEAELLVPSRAIGFIAPGDSVLLRYQAFPYQKFGHHEGRVASISRSALNSGELGTLIGNAEKSEPFYRVTVALNQQTVMAYGQPESLKPGMVLDAEVLGENRRLIEWIFEPLYSLKGKVRSG